METERVRGNPPGITNTHVAANIRAARQAIGMDLRTMSDALGAAGRKLSPSGISKLENGDRRVDVDDLTVIAYLLRTSPAASSFWRCKCSSGRLISRSRASWLT